MNAGATTQMPRRIPRVFVHAEARSAGRGRHVSSLLRRDGQPDEIIAVELLRDVLEKNRDHERRAPPPVRSPNRKGRRIGLR